MNIIEERYEPIKNIVRVLMANYKKLGTKRNRLISTTLTFIYPATTHGYEVQKMLAKIENEMINAAVLVIPVLGRTFDINDIDDEIDKAIGLSKKYTDETMKITDNLKDSHLPKDGAKFLENLIKASRPQ